MTPNQRERFERIEAFPLDGGPTTRGFAARLAKENRWSRRFTERAIREYRRFIFLMAEAGHGVSPSPVIDQVWHLHLIYTRSYWDELCAGIVGRPLHHHPSQPGQGDGAKFEGWYEQTLASYRRLFGEAPPADIWPPAGTPHPEHRWADVRRDWVIPKPPIAVRAALIGVAALLAVLAASSADAATLAQSAGWTLNPFDLNGPDFLVFYAAVATLAIIACVRLRSWFRSSNQPAEAQRAKLDEYEVAYLHGGPTLAVNAAIISLTERGLVEAERRTTRLIRRGQPTGKLHELEAAVLHAVCEGGTRVATVRSESWWAAERIRDKLVDMGYMLDEQRAKGAQIAIGMLGFVPVVLGVIKMIIGMSRGRPIEYLIFVTIAMGTVAIAIAARPMRRTRSGDDRLRELQARHKALRPKSGDPSGAVVTAVALFGMAALAGTAYADMHRTLTPPGGNGSGAGCGGGTSCGGGDSGDGSSCGGGCGGCGGD